MSFAKKLEGMFSGESLDFILTHHTAEVSLACTNNEYLDELQILLQGLRDRGLIQTSILI